MNPLWLLLIVLVIAGAVAALLAWRSIKRFEAFCREMDQ